MPRIESFRFSSIVIGGKTYGRDVLILPDGAVKQRRGGFWKFGSHTIRKGEIEELVKAKPEIVVVGIGTDAKARLEPDAQLLAKESTLELFVLPSREAIKRLNQIIDEGRRAAALIHITC